MRYFVFEAGSRAGFSTEKFFQAYLQQTGAKDTLVMVDSDPLFPHLKSPQPNIMRVSEEEAMAMLNDGDTIFPADELTRQKNSHVRGFASANPFSAIDVKFYNKTYINSQLSFVKSNIAVPKTFSNTTLFIKPNVLSAGSKECHAVKDVCVEEYINIKGEYVVDCYEREGKIDLYPREVKLKNGYDKYIMILPQESEFCDSVRDFITASQQKVGGLFKGIFHLQLARDFNGNLFYIESSKRISGSSIVNIERGFNPFCFMVGLKAYDNVKHLEGVWYRFEDFLYDV